jgi:amino acid permease
VDLSEASTTASSMRVSLIKKEVETKKGGLTSFEGALSLLSTMIGGGIVTLPFSFRQLGIPLGLFACVAVMCLTQVSALLWLKTKRLMPSEPNSVYQIGFKLLGSKSIYLMAALVLLLCVGACIVYFIIFGKTCMNLAV